MRTLLTIFLIGSSLFKLTAQDTLFLAGEMRNYKDSLVFRWNCKQATDYLEMSKSNIIIEMKNKDDGIWQNLTTLGQVNINSFSQSDNTIDKSKLLAAAALQQMRQLMDNLVDDPASAIQKNQDLNFLWMNLSLASDLDPSTANKCHLRHAIHINNIEETKIYRLYVSTKNFVSDTLYFVPGTEIFTPQHIDAPEAYEKENEVELLWTADKTYSAYFIERAGIDGVFSQLNNAPIVIPSQMKTKLYYKDSVSNYKAYTYRLYAIDMFGERSLYSESLKAMGRDRTPPSLPVGLKINETSDKQLIISWNTIPDNEGSKGLALGIRHNEGMSYQPLVKQLLPLNITKYKIPIDTTNTDYYIILQVFDTANNSSSTEAFYQLNDNTAPNAPSGLIAQCNKNGVVTLRWNQNKERDLQGYLIYTSSHIKAEFSGIVNVPIIDTVFQDTISLRLLNKDVYYKVVAVDFRLNRSKNSETVKIVRPDTIPPVTPIFISYQTKDTSIDLHLVPSSSDDVKQNYLVRIMAGSKQTTTIKLNPEDTFYKDMGLRENSTYTYFMYAEDWSGNISPKSVVLELKTLKNYYKPAVKLFTVVYDSTNRSVSITWQYDMRQVKRVWIYKGPTPGEMSKMPDQVKEGANSFTDKRTKQGEWYYAIKLYFLDGTETLLSIPLGVKID